MNYSGSGAQADPYIVFDWEGFIYCLGTATSSKKIYVELGDNLEAPTAATTTVTMNYLKQLDGKGFSINGLCGSYVIYAESNHTYIKNISFTNHYCYDRCFINYVGSNNHSSYLHLENVKISGLFDSCMLFYRADVSYVYNLYLSSVSINAETRNGQFEIQNTGDDLYLENLNVKIKYRECSPQRSLYKTIYHESKYCLYNIQAEDATNNLSFGGKITNCCIIGNCQGINVPAAAGVNVVENTIPPTVSSGYESYVNTVSTADMKNPATLADLGFPIGVD